MNSTTDLELTRVLVVESGRTAHLSGTCWRRPPLLLAALLAAAPAQARGGRPAVAFFYGTPVPVAELGNFDWVVVEPEHLDAGGLANLQRAGAQVFAYLSLGEGEPGTVPASWVLGRNAGWGGVIVNPASPEWRSRILSRAETLWERGYRGLFLDTLDSYVSVLSGDEARRAAGAALAGLVRAIHDRHPDLKLFFNRGFEILDDVGRLACGLAAESLFFGWDAAAKRYVEVPEADREWLVGRLRKVKERLGIPVVVVDYLPAAPREAARAAARRIEALGFTPWISTPALDVLGVGTVEVVPRRMLLLYDGAEFPALAQSPIHRLAALPVEVLGFAADYLDVRRGLPPEPLVGRYAGIVTWFTDDDLPDAIGYAEWLMRQIASGVRVAMLARPGFAASKSFLARLGLGVGPAPPAAVTRVVKRDGLVGLEAEPALRRRGLVPWHAASSEVHVHLRLEDERGQPIDPVVTAPWGGLALDPYLLEIGYQGTARWIVDPFAFLEVALALPPAPAFDLTTENGARLLVVVADGDGLGRPAQHGTATAAEVVLRRVLAALPVPTTVAMPPGELDSRHGAGTSRLQRVAKAIFALPGVEPAGRLSVVADDGNAASAKAEVEASVAALRGLLPAGKELRAFLWPDGGAATLQRLAAAAALGMENLASGGEPDAARASLTEIPPSGCPLGDAFEVYLPGGSAGGSSGAWSRSRSDPGHPLALAERTETPRRLKPIGLHYRLSVGAEPAGLRALEEALRWALEQGALPLWSSEYARRVREFQTASLARGLDGTWQFRSLHALRTVRLPRTLGWPDPSRSRGVASASALGEWRYVTFGPGDSATLALAEQPAPGPYRRE